MTEAKKNPTGVFIRDATMATPKPSGKSTGNNPNNATTAPPLITIREWADRRNPSNEASKYFR